MATLSLEDVLETVKHINNEKTAGASGITVDLLMVCEEEFIIKLTKV